MSPGIGYPWQGSVTEPSVQNQCSIGYDMSRNEAAHDTIGVSLPQNPFSHINATFQVLLLFNTLGH